MKLLDISTRPASEIKMLPDRIRTVTALGNFDGVHIGHRAVFDATVALAAERDHTSPAVFTFSPHPFFKTQNCLLSTDSERLALFCACGIRYVFLCEFDEVMDLSPEAFVSKILRSVCHADIAVCGSNFHYGNKKAGNCDTLIRQMQNAGGNAMTVENVQSDGETVSSTRIRRLLTEGSIAAANKLLARPYSISGEIIHGSRIGHKMSIPTINLRIPEQKIIPKFGVYCSDVLIGNQQFSGVTNIGIKPTVENHDKTITVETHLTDCTQELYGEYAIISLLAFLREERKFPDLRSLQTQIQLDMKAALAFREEQTRS